MSLETPIDFLAAAREYLGITERHLFRLCEQYQIPRRYRYNGPHRARVRVMWKSEVEMLQPIVFRLKRNLKDAQPSVAELST